MDARFSRNSLANPASCTQLALFFLPLKTTINKKDLKLVPASKIMEMFLLSAAPPSLSWRRDRFPSKPLKLPLFLFFCQQWTVDPLPLDIHRLTTKDAQIFRDLPELEALPSTTRHTWRIHLCHHYVFAIMTSLPLKRILLQMRISEVSQLEPLVTSMTTPLVAKSHGSWTERLNLIIPKDYMIWQFPMIAIS